MKANAKVKVTLGGSALKAYTSITELTIVPKDAAKKLTGDLAKVGPTVIKAGGTAGENSV